MKIPARELKTVELRELNEDSVVATACAVLEGAGYSGSYTEPVIEALSWRFDMCRETNMSLSAFLSPVMALSHDITGNGARRDSIAKRVSDQETMLKVIKGSTGELRQKFSGGASL